MVSGRGRGSWGVGDGEGEGMVGAEGGASGRGRGWWVRRVVPVGGGRDCGVRRTDGDEWDAIMLAEPRSSSPQVCVVRRW